MRNCTGVRELIPAFDNWYCNSVCEELQCSKYENENRLKPSWTSVKWNGWWIQRKNNVLGTLMDGDRSFSTLDIR